MTTELTITNGQISAGTLEKVLVSGDLKELTPAQRVEYYSKVCESTGLNPLTKPFDYITLNGKLTLYAKRDATDQLRERRKISVRITGRDFREEVYIVTAQATTPDNRQDESTGVVTIAGLRGDALANALMKAETKAKRRVTLSICGLGWLDESELDTVPQARSVPVDDSTGEIIEAPPTTPHPAGNPAPPSLRALAMQAIKFNLINKEEPATWCKQAGVSRLEELDPLSQASLSDRLQKMLDGLAV